MLQKHFTWKYTFSLVLLFQLSLWAQHKLPQIAQNNAQSDNIYMTWNKYTPEQEMNDDIKALGEKGVTIDYSNLKRNDKNEIVGIRVSYTDDKGNKGSLEYDNQKPINTIRFYKQDGELGFGRPENSNSLLAENDFGNSFPDAESLMKQFQLGGGNPNLQQFSFSFPDGKGTQQSKSKMIIKNDGKKTLIIEDGKVVEGGDDYTPDELDKIKKENKMNLLEDTSPQDMEGLDFQNHSDLNKTKDDMLKAKEEMMKAKEELQNAKKELEQAKSSLKTQKA